MNEATLATVLHLDDFPPETKVFTVRPLAHDSGSKTETLEIGGRQSNTIFLRDDQVRGLEAELATSRYSGQGQAFEAALAIHRGHEAGREALRTALA